MRMLKYRLMASGLRSIGVPALVAALVAAGACTVAIAAEPVAQRFPDVVAARVRFAADRTRHDFDVTISSPYDSPERYADAFRIMSADGTVLGERSLLHDHADEQPFTRELHGVVIPADLRQVTIQARDRLNGYGGKTVDTPIPGR